MDIARGLEYTDFIQDLIGPVGYWKDPYNLENYSKGCKSLNLLENAADYNESVKTNFLGLDLLIVCGGPKDGMMQPW